MGKYHQNGGWFVDSLEGRRPSLGSSPALEVLKPFHEPVARVSSLASMFGASTSADQTPQESDMRQSVTR